ncbi:oxygen-independent coproporphyrinogen III oxidase [Campylobacter canadensis]|uniref:oxygen-independent coproporphyrinogen III oxidase n=1 Tax=Campylobacter canadensis TaxID=449520 RepID=UPI0037BF0D98
MMDFSVLSKFQKAGPRYTSYPTAIEFSTNYTYDEYIKDLSSNKEQNLSLYFHLPFCRSACYFCGCNVIYTANEDKKERYLKYLLKEIDLIKDFLPNKNILQMHFGGGTPTFFNAKQLELLLNKISKEFSFLNDAELSCEIDPRFLVQEQMQVFADYKINRISFGVQDFDETVQKQIHRIQPYEVTQKAVLLARKYGVKSINTDLIYGLPFQSVNSFNKTLEQILTLNPDRLAVFNYAHVPWIKKNMRKFDESTIPNANIKLEILKNTASFLTQNGYEMIGMDHFAKPSDELFKALKDGTLHRNFQGYTTKGGAKLVGIGLTSIGEGLNYYAQNHKELSDYENAIDNNLLPYHKGVKLSQDDLIRKYVIMQLMANYKLDIKQTQEKFNINFWDYFSQAKQDLLLYKDYINISDEAITINQTGTLLIRNICMSFDAYMKNKVGKIFSKTL